MSPEQQLHAWVSGQVQGVSFRWFTLQRARALRLRGWVKNLADGRVELLAQGPEERLRKLLNQVWQGPPGARVSGVRDEWEEVDLHLGEFRIEG